MPEKGTIDASSFCSIKRLGEVVNEEVVMKNKGIAAHFGVSQSVVSRALKKPSFKVSSKKKGPKHRLTSKSTRRIIRTSLKSQKPVYLVEN